MKTALIFSAAAVALAAGCGDRSSQTAGQTNSAAAPHGASGVLTAPVDYLGALGRGKQDAEKTVDTASITKAIEMFQADKGRYPRDLDELVQEKYLPRIPEPPYGMKLTYDPNTGQVAVVKQ